MSLLGAISSRRVVCLDWDSRHLRAVHAVIGRGGARVLRIAEIPIPVDVDLAAPVSFGPFIRRALHEHGIRADRAVLAVPQQSVWLGVLKLPHAPMSELPSMVRFQVSKELSFSIEQSVIDFVVLGGGAKSDRDEMSVLAAAARGPALEYYKILASEAGLTLDRIGLRPFANRVAVTLGGANRTGHVVVVDVGPSMTEISVLRDGELVFARAPMVAMDRGRAGGAATDAAGGGAADAEVIPFGDSGDSASPVDDLLVQVTRTVEAYRATDPGASIDQFLIACSSGIEEMLSEAITRRYRTKTSIYQPDADVLREVDRRSTVHWPAFSAALGLAYGQAAAPAAYFDFLHPKKPIDVRKQKIRRVPVIGGLIAATVVAGGLAVGLRIQARTSQIAALTAEINDTKQKIKDLTPFAKLVDTAVDWRNDAIVWLDEMRLIADAMPSNEDAYLRELSVVSDDEIVLKLVARSGDVLSKFSRRLADQKAPGGARRYSVIVGARQPNSDATYVVQQEIKVRVEVPVVERPAKPKTTTKPATTKPSARVAVRSED